MSDTAVVEPTQTKDAPWQMPKPRKGQSILFFPGGTVSQRNAEIAFATRIGDRSIHVAYRSTGYDSVFHVDDPRLVENIELRRQIPGVWDFTDQDKDTDRRIAACESEIKELKRALQAKSQQRGTKKQDA